MKIKKGYLILATLVFSLQSFSIDTNINCDKLKKGKYFYYSQNSREKILVDRTDSLQIETNQSGKVLMKNKIVWREDCKFDMYLNAFSNSKLGEIDSIIAATPSHVEIIDISDAFYIFITKMDIFNKKFNYMDTLYFRK